jgi:hypothetical protein
MGWEGPMTQDGVPVVLEDSPRYDNPYGTADFPAQRIAFKHAGQSLTLDLDEQTRKASCFQQ